MNPDTATDAKLKEILSSHPTLNQHERHDVANQLQAVLVDLTDLSLIGKQLHWNVTGTHFKSLHLMLDELVDSWRLLSDTVAERVNALGLAPDGRAATVAADSEVDAVPDGPIKGSDVVQMLTERLGATIARVGDRIERVGEIDPVSEDVLIGVNTAPEENHWMIAAQQV